MSVRTLDRAPDLGALYRRAGKDVVLGFLPGGGKSGDSLPEDVLQLESVEIDRDHLADYNRVCGFQLSDVLPATYLHNVTFPLAMELMTSSAFPFPVVGMVHVENTIEQLRPVTADERPTVRLWVENLRPHRAGQQLDVVGEAEIDGEIVWRDRSVYLRRGKTEGPRPKKSPGKGQPPAPQPEAVWALGGDTGRQFAAVSGDSNPIHMSALAAKAFGMPAAIAHGMYVKARCLAQLESQLTDAFTIEVGFKAPVVLPTKVGFASAKHEDRLAFTVHGTRKPTQHLRGSLSPA